MSVNVLFDSDFLSFFAVGAKFVKIFLSTGPVPLQLHYQKVLPRQLRHSPVYFVRANARKKGSNAGLVFESAVLSDYHSSLHPFVRAIQSI